MGTQSDFDGGGKRGNEIGLQLRGVRGWGRGSALSLLTTRGGGLGVWRSAEFCCGLGNLEASLCPTENPVGSGVADVKVFRPLMWMR